MRLVLPWPPSVNHLHSVARGRKILSARGRAYEDLVAWTLKGRGSEPMDGPVRVSLKCLPPDRRRRDLDNVLKAVLDALTKGRLWRDDSQVRRLEAEMLAPVGESAARVEVEVTEWTKEEKR